MLPIDTFTFKVHKDLTGGGSFALHVLSCVFCQLISARKPMTLQALPQFIHDNYEILEWNHATAILERDFPEEWNDLVELLVNFRLQKSHIIVGGKNKSMVAKALDSVLYGKGWIEKTFDTKQLVDNEARETPTHKIDCYKNKVGIEIEWNNKDPFFDRDLTNFRLLFDLKTISVGVIITRSSELQQIFNSLGRSSSYGNSTTHFEKLRPKMLGAGSGGCPVIAFGIKKSLYVEDDQNIVPLSLLQPPSEDGEEALVD
jgi:hypothetical protein